MIARVGAVATHDVLHFGRIEADSFLEARQNLAKHSLWVKVRKATLALLADSTRRPHRVDDPGLSFHAGVLPSVLYPTWVGQVDESGWHDGRPS